jgi:hypothetical protein
MEVIQLIQRFVIYPLNYTILLIDISEIGLPSGIYPPEGDPKLVHSLRFHNGTFAEQFLLKKGADAHELEKVFALVAKGSIAVLTIPERMPWSM